MKDAHQILQAAQMHRSSLSDPQFLDAWDFDHGYLAGYRACLLDQGMVSAPASADLDQAAKEYYLKTPPMAASSVAVQDAFKAGAAWQAAKDVEKPSDRLVPRTYPEDARNGRPGRSAEECTGFANWCRCEKCDRAARGYVDKGSGDKDPLDVLKMEELAQTYEGPSFRDLMNAIADVRGMAHTLDVKFSFTIECRRE